MSWNEIGMWVIVGFSGLLSALAFGHSLGAPMRIIKMLDQLPKAPKPIPYEGLPLYQSKGEKIDIFVNTGLEENKNHQGIAL